jgi:hypothetical protein
MKKEKLDNINSNEVSLWIDLKHRLNSLKIVFEDGSYISKKMML